MAGWQGTLDMAGWQGTRDLNWPSSEQGVGHLEVLGSALGEVASTGWGEIFASGLPVRVAAHH
jgi:hypothetical protein